MIEIRNLSKRYGRVLAVNDLSFTVPAGSAVALWGHNGAGKTTTLKCLLGLTSFQGQIRIDGLDIRRAPKEVRRRIGYVPQSLALYDMSVAQTLQFFCGLKKVPLARGFALLAEVGLEGQERKSVAALSGGMRQRLALALALLADPPVLVLDEPTANLDTQARRDLMHLLHGCKGQGRTVVFASHRPDEVLELADRVVVMEGGRLKLECTGPELVAQLGIGTWLRVRLESGTFIEDAVTALTAGGYTYEKNGAYLWVRVEPGRKGAPLAVLARAGLQVLDFELEDEKWTSPQ